MTVEGGIYVSLFASQCRLVKWVTVLIPIAGGIYVIPVELVPGVVYNKFGAWFVCKHTTLVTKSWFHWLWTELR